MIIRYYTSFYLIKKKKRILVSNQFKLNTFSKTLGIDFEFKQITFISMSIIYAAKLIVKSTISNDISDWRTLDIDIVVVWSLIVARVRFQFPGVLTHFVDLNFRILKTLILETVNCEGQIRRQIPPFLWVIFLLLKC